MGVKYKVNEYFFDDWSPEMAYVLGLIFSDGSLENSPDIRGKYVRFSSTDKSLVELMQKLLDSVHPIVTYKRSARHKRGYMIRIGSHRLYDGLVKLGVTPRKSLTMSFPGGATDYLTDFVRGYFDGDGCAHVEYKDGSPLRLTAIFTSGSLGFLETIANLLAAKGMTQKRVYKHGSTTGAYQLRYSTRDSVRLFQFMYASSVRPDLCLMRKWVIFDRFLSQRGLSPAVLGMELTRSGPMVKRKHGDLQNRYSAGSIPARASRAK